VALIATSLACMVVSTSTTAYFGIAVFVVLGTWHFAKRRWARLYENPRLSKGLPGALGAAAVTVVVAGVLASHNWELVDTVFTANVLEKGDTSSFEERHGVDRMALDIIGKTGGIGIGLGSHKPNSLLMTIASNAGLGGLASFALFLIGSLGPWRPTVNGVRGSVELTAAMAPIRWLVIGLLIIHSFANPNLSSVLLWIGFGAVIGLRASTQGRVLALRGFDRGARIEAPI
jgi:hypothetical protein